MQADVILKEPPHIEGVGGRGPPPRTPLPLPARPPGLRPYLSPSSPDISSF